MGRNLVKLEAFIQQKILASWGAHPRLRIWRMNTGAAKLGDRLVRFGLKGQADISGVIEGGRRLEIECKTDVGEQSDTQKKFEQMIRHFGGVYILARSLEDVDRVLIPIVGAK